MSSTNSIGSMKPNLSRLFSFYKEGFIHAVSYRVLIFISLLTAAFLIIDIFVNSTIIILTTKILILITWILFTPQLFSVFVVMVVYMTKGLAFGNLNPSFVNTLEKNEQSLSVYKSIPYIAIAIWLLAFIALSLMWFS